MTSFNAPYAKSAFAAYRAAAGAYTQVQAHTSVDGATPHELVSMLFDGLQESLVQARGAIARRDIPAKCEALSRAARIVDEGLKASLNLQEGGELAQKLHGLYAYTSALITKANLKSDDALVLQAMNLMQPLRDAWNRIGPQDRTAA